MICPHPEGYIITKQLQHSLATWQVNYKSTKLTVNQIAQN